MYREAINTLAFITGLILILAAGNAFAEPATEETVHQLTQFLPAAAMALCFALGVVAGQQR